MNEILKILMQCHLQKKNPISNNETYLWTLDKIYTHVYYHYKSYVINVYKTKDVKICNNNFFSYRIGPEQINKFGLFAWK